MYGCRARASCNSRPYTDAALRLGVYTAHDYTDILESLLKEWQIDSVTGLTDAAERARDYVVALPARLRRVAGRGGGAATGVPIPED